MVLSLDNYDFLDNTQLMTDWVYPDYLVESNDYNHHGTHVIELSLHIPGYVYTTDLATIVPADTTWNLEMTDPCK
jgi:hypothetical protein